jgi:hypothetical protein
VTIKNLLAQSATIVDAAGLTVATIPTSGIVATVIVGSVQSAPALDGIPVVLFARPVSVTGLPGADDESPILVSAIVADAMRQLGLRHAAGVYSPQQLMFDANRKSLGTPGLIYHSDLS